MAEVFLAKSSGTQGFEKVVAIKRILPSVSQDSDFTTMFIDEAKISANLTHANIGQVYEFGQANGQYYIAMEYIPGRDLRAIQSRLADTGRVLDLSAALHIGTRLCQALDYAHRQKNAAGTSMDIVHRDVSPPNVIVSFEGAIKLIDFGIAKAASRATRTRAGKLKGKFSYMSPEQVQGLPVDRRSDIFSLGVLLYELLTAKRLFHGENHLATLNLVRQAEVAPPSTVNPEVPLEVDRIVLKALARSPEQRYAWATEFRADIERYLARTGIVFETQQMADWMCTEFPGEIEAERLMRERIYSMAAKTLPEAPAPAEQKPRPELAPVDEETRAEHHGAVTGAIVSPPGADKFRPRASDEITAAGLSSDAALTIGGVAMPEAGLLASPSTPFFSPALERSDSTPPQLHRSGEVPIGAQKPPPESQALAAEPSLSHDDSPMLAGDELDMQVPDTNPHALEFDQEPERPPLPRGREVSEVPLGATIAPGQHRNRLTVRGALEIDSADRPMPEVLDEEPVDLRALGEHEIERQRATVSRERAALSGTREVNTNRMSGLKAALLAAGVTLLLAVVVFVTVGAVRGCNESSEPGSVLVTTTPQASCSVAVGLTPKGLLQPGGSLTLNGLPPGRHLVSLQCLGFLPYATTVEIKSAQSSIVIAPLKKN